MIQYYSLKEASKISEIPISLIKRAIKEGLVIFIIQSGKNIFFSKEEVQRWISRDKELGERIKTIPEKFPIRKSSYISKNKYILPFKGIWLAGGDHPQHCVRYASDFVVIDESDFHRVKIGISEDELVALKMHHGTNERNPRDFLCYGKEIIAPASGKIIMASNPEDFKEENIDGQGHIVIDHGNGEYGRLCHILGKSIRVKTGDLVKQGQVLGLAAGKLGDGIHRVPHLHWDVWDYRHFLFAKGLPVRISKAIIYNYGHKKVRYNFYIQSGMLVSNG